MNFLAIDTSGVRLAVAAYKEGKLVLRTAESEMKHSVLLMDETDAALKEAGLSLSDCDFLAAVVGPGSFTGIRIGISAVKGMCFAAEKPALALTSFDCLAYAERGGMRLALVDAGHGNFYAQRFDGDTPARPAFIGREEREAAEALGYRPVWDGNADRARGMAAAALALSGRCAPASELRALYLRKCSAEENRK